MFFSAYRGSVVLDESHGSTVTSGIDPLATTGSIWLRFSIEYSMSL